jgi:hypothetical protein
MEMMCWFWWSEKKVGRAAKSEDLGAAERDTGLRERWSEKKVGRAAKSEDLGAAERDTGLREIPD